MNKKIENRGYINRGYITLMSAIIISGTLMAIMFDQSLYGFYARFSVLNHEKKTASFYLALSCVQRMRLLLAKDEDYARKEPMQTSEGKCNVGEIGHDGEEFVFRVETVVEHMHDASTHLDVKINPEDDLLFISESLVQ